MAKKRARTHKRASRLPFGRKNYALLALGLVLILLGFVLLSTGDITLAPLLLFLGYCVFIPAGILVKPRTSGDESGASGE